MVKSLARINKVTKYFHMNGENTFQTLLRHDRQEIGTSKLSQLTTRNKYGGRIEIPWK